MFNSVACDRSRLIEKLSELNFCGPFEMGGNSFLLYHGELLALPGQDSLTVTQFRFFLSSVNELISEEEWAV